MRLNKRTIILMVVSVIILVVCIGFTEDGFIVEKRKESRRVELQESLSEICPGIICWGDSLTVGTGGNGTYYPDVLEQQIQEKLMPLDLLPENIADAPVIEVINMGVGGEDTNTILGRNGAVPFVVSEDFVIPKEAEPVEITFCSANGKVVGPLRQGNRGMESVAINGVEGIIQVIQESYTSQAYSYTFTRNKKGKSVEVIAGTPIITQGSGVGLDCWTAIFMGENGGYDSPADLIEQQRAIINHQTSNNEKFIIIGLHTGTAEERAELEEAMINEYGERYINLREYLCTKGLNDAGLNATEEDLAMMQLGMTPASLMIEDKCHFNEHGYRLIGELIFERMNQLGYFEEVQNIIDATIAEWEEKWWK